jgi:shikimate dehydrogenase
MLDAIDTEAKIIGAVNTVAVVDGKLTGYNTDGIGFIASLKEKAKFDVAGKYAVIIGCGGASRAIACYMLKEGLSFLGLCDIDTKRAHALAKDLRKHYKNACIHVYASSSEIDLSGVDLLVNATGLGRKNGDPAVIDTKKLHKRLFVYDLIYSPAEPALLKAAKAKGCKTMNGLWMLIYQALKAEEIWQGKAFPGEEKTLLAGVKKAGVL